MNITTLPILRFFIRYVRTYKVKSGLIALALIVLLGMVAQTVLRQANGEPQRERTVRVSLLNVDEYRIENAIIESVGEVESLSQVELKSQISERVKEIRVAIGQRVSRGEVLIVLDSVSLTSQILQAEASLESAQAGLDKIKLEQQQQLRGDTLNKSYEDGLVILGNLHEEIESTLDALDDILFGSLLSGGGETNIQYYANANNNISVVARLERLYRDAQELRQQSVTDYQAAERGSGKGRPEAIQSGYTLTVKTAETIKTGRDAVRDFQDTILDSTTVHTKQTVIDGHVRALNEYAASIDEYLNDLLHITNTVNKQSDVLQAYPITIQSQKLLVKERQAVLENLLTQQNEVVIASPISGTVASLPIRVGELVNAREVVASIVNPGNLQVKTYLNGRDIQFVTQGAKALVEGALEGSVAKIAPSLDSKTRKVETVIALVGAGNKELVVGEFANVQIFIDENLHNGDKFFLPLQSIKVTSQAAFVYVLTKENIIQEAQVQLGRVIGDSVEVVEGVERGMHVVFSTRGLEPGDKVESEQ